MSRNGAPTVDGGHTPAPDRLSHCPHARMTVPLQKLDPRDVPPAPGARRPFTGSSVSRGLCCRESELLGHSVHPLAPGAGLPRSSSPSGSAALLDASEQGTSLLAEEEDEGGGWVHGGARPELLLPAAGSGSEMAHGGTRLDCDASEGWTTTVFTEWLGLGRMAS